MNDDGIAKHIEWPPGASRAKQHFGGGVMVYLKIYQGRWNNCFKNWCTVGGLFWKTINSNHYNRLYVQILYCNCLVVTPLATICSHGCHISVYVQQLLTPFFKKKKRPHIWHAHKWWHNKNLYDQISNSCNWQYIGYANGCDSVWFCGCQV